MSNVAACWSIAACHRKARVCACIYISFVNFVVVVSFHFQIRNCSNRFALCHNCRNLYFSHRKHMLLFCFINFFFGSHKFICFFVFSVAHATSACSIHMLQSLNYAIVSRFVVLVVVFFICIGRPSVVRRCHLVGNTSMLFVWFLFFFICMCVFVCVYVVFNYVLLSINTVSINK